MTTGEGVADLRPLWRSKDQKAWYWYDSDAHAQPSANLPLHAQMGRCQSR
jgi:hypothetical protein